MQTFELTYQDGKREQIKAENFSELFTTLPLNNSVIKAEVIDARLIRAAVRDVNKKFHEFCGKYHQKEAIAPFIRDTLSSHGFDYLDLLDQSITSEQGEERGLPVGRGIYLCLTWYRMPSGRFEVVAYVS